MRGTAYLHYSGFTVIEFLIVVAMLAIIAVAGYNYWGFDRGCGVRSPVSRVRTDHRSLATAIEAYYVDNNRYPLMRPFIDFPINLNRLRDAGGIELSSIEPGGAGVGGVTTPISYITSLFPDPYAPEKGMPFAYWTPAGGQGWILLSPGPDEVYNLTPKLLETVYNPSIPQPSALLLTGGGPRGAFTYDPTNGTESVGDLWRVKQ